MPIALPEYEYADSLEVRRIRTDGSMKWGGEYIFVGGAMAGELIGLEPIDEGHWHLYLGAMRLGVLHERARTVMPLAVDGQKRAVTHVPGHAT